MRRFAHGEREPLAVHELVILERLLAMTSLGYHFRRRVWNCDDKQQSYQENDPVSQRKPEPGNPTMKTSLNLPKRNKGLIFPP